jgi:hypothetical protein
LKPTIGPVLNADGLEEGAVPHLPNVGPGLSVARGAVLREIEGEVDDLLRLGQLLSTVRKLRLGLSATSALIRAGLLALECRNVDRVGEVGAQQLPLVGELAKAPA